MAHNLATNRKTGKASFMSVKEKPWHLLGVVLNEPATSEEAIREAGLDFEVAKEPVWVPTREIDRTFASTQSNVLCIRDENSSTKYSEVKQVPDRFATFRTDDGTPFGVVGSRYEVVQNRDAFQFFDAIVGSGQAIYETAGALYDGRTIFITAKLPSYIHVGKDDAIEKYLLLTMSHDGSGSIQAMFTSTRVVCANTLAVALKSGQCKVSIRHTKSAHENLKQAHTIMGITNKLSEELASIYNDMSKVRINDKQLLDYIQTVVLGDTLERMIQKDDKFELSTRSKNIIGDITKYAYEHPTQQLETTKGSVWGAYNSITGYYQNVKNYKTQEDKMDSIYMGSVYDTTQKAMNLAYDLIK